MAFAILRVSRSLAAGSYTSIFPHMIYTEENDLIIKIPGFSKDDIPRIINALSDGIKFIDPDHYESIKHTDYLFYIGTLIDAFTPSEDQFNTINLSEK